MYLDTIINKSPDKIIQNIAYSVKERRLELNLTQKSFCKRTGVGYDAYRKFETTGEITLKNLILCAIALDDTESFETLFSKKNYQSIDEILQQKEPKKRMRGAKND